MGFVVLNKHVRGRKYNEIVQNGNQKSLSSCILKTFSASNKPSCSASEQSSSIQVDTFMFKNSRSCDY